MKYSQVKFKQIFTLFLIVCFLVCQNICQNLLYRMFNSGFGGRGESNNLFKEKRDPKKVSLNCDNSLSPLSALGKTVESKKNSKNVLKSFLVEGIRGDFSYSVL